MNVDRALLRHRGPQQSKSALQRMCATSAKDRAPLLHKPLLHTEGLGSSSSSCSHPACSSRSCLRIQGCSTSLVSLAACATLPSLIARRRRSRGQDCGLGHRSVVGRRARARRAGADSRKGANKVKLQEDVPAGTDFYQVLGVQKDATQEDIRVAYKRLIRETHPDVNPSTEAANLFIQVQEAFRWLSDPQQREVYDGVGSKFGIDAIYDYTDEPILGSLSGVHEIVLLKTAINLVNRCRKELTYHKAIEIDYNVKDIRARFRKFGKERIMWVRDYLCTEIRRIMAYPKLLRRLHPFERLSVELSLHEHMQQDGVAFGKVLACLKDLKQRLSEEAASRASACANAERGRLSTFIADEAIETMWDLVIDHEPIFQQCRACQTAIFRAPVVDLDKPTIVLVGAPNVGKSSLVRSVSSGEPEVADYCYTTKKLTIGHLWHFIAGTPLLVHGQVVDSPGLKCKPGENLNLLDQLSMGAMENLPTGVVYVFDPYPDMHGLLSVDDQVELREALRAKFPKRPWLDVITKVDLEDQGAKEGIEDLSRLYPNAILVSALDGTGLDILNMKIRQLLEEMTRVVRQLQRSKIRQLRVGATDSSFVGKEALSLR